MEFVWLALIILAIVGWWKCFEKAGQPGWAAIIPFYNIWVLVTISKREPTVLWFVMFLIPILNIVAAILVCLDIAKKFGKSEGFGIGLALLGFIFFPILGFSDATYSG